MIFKICFAYGRSEEDRQDLFQEIVAQLWAAFGKYHPERPFSTWLYRIGLNTAISHVRRQVRRRRVECPAGEAIVEFPQPEGVEHPADELGELKRCIDALSPLNKALVVLHLEGKSHREIGEILGTTESNIGTRLSRIKQTLREHLAPRDATPSTTSVGKT